MRTGFIARLGMGLALVLCLSVQAMGAVGQPVGKVAAVKGTVSVTRAGEAASAPLSVRDQVYQNDRITTGEQSRVKLLMSDDTVLTLGQKGDLVFQDYTVNTGEKKRSSVLKLVSGNLRSIISKLFGGVGSRFEVHTPTAVAGARGTVNTASVIDQDNTFVIGEEGGTEVNNIDTDIKGSRVLTGNFGCYVKKGEPPSEPFLVPAGQLLDLHSDTVMARAPEFKPEDVANVPSGSGLGGGPTTEFTSPDAPTLAPRTPPSPPASQVPAPPVQHDFHPPYPEQVGK